MDDYKGLADSDAVRALADLLGDPDGAPPEPAKPPEPSNGKRRTRGIFHDSVIVGLYRASIGTVIAVVAIVGYNKLNGETLRERARADATAMQLEEQTRIIAQWQSLVEEQKAVTSEKQKLANDWEAMARERDAARMELESLVLRNRGELARAAATMRKAIDSGEINEVGVLLGALANTYRDRTFSDEDLIEQFAEVMRALLDRLAD